MSKLGSAPMASSEHANAIPWRWIETTLTLHLMKQGISRKNQHLNPASFRINIKRKGDECHLALPTTTLNLSKAVHVIDIHFMRTHKQSAMNKFKACFFKVHGARSVKRGKIFSSVISAQCPAKRRSMSPSATLATPNGSQCHRMPRGPKRATRPSPVYTISATPPTQKERGCRVCV